ncbi:hypothetical protein UFOVP1202_70 [uncultured Caudovirales phage]|uniref:Uncharacterized protein n=1 Tax=uncultured Caudovirales phage TaxID=2100421 RepID=A0A6J5R0P0_9CAUD|nr:hypothetical protein UFOVP1202_70 [uncultured Caudovirales phage]
MANATGSFGLRPINLAGGAPNSQGTNAYFIGSTASAIYQGSPVIAVNAGQIAITGSASGDTYKHVGAFQGCEYVSSTTGKKVFSNFWPGSGYADTNFDIIGNVYDNPMQRFVIATDASFTSRATAKAAIFESTQFATATSGSAVNGSSSASLNVATLDSSNLSLPLKILGIYENPINQDFTAAGVQMIVMFNNHALLEADSEGTVA